jgi:glycosyltransferase involved in cell wall biosynthesis
LSRQGLTKAALNDESDRIRIVFLGPDVAGRLQRSPPFPMAPVVSVIVPAYNAARHIDATLSSILSQTGVSFEVIVVDDGSTDHTPQRLRSYGHAIRSYRQANSGGCSKPRNVGIGAARGQILAFFDSDDIMLPGRLARHVAFLERHPNAGALFSNYRRFDDSGEPGLDHFAGCPGLTAWLAAAGRGAATLGAVIPSPDATRLLVAENFGCAMMTARRAVFERAGLYDESMRASEDFDMQYRIAECFAIGVLPHVDWHKRMHASSMTSATENIFKWKIHTRERILAREADPDRQRELRRTLAGFHAGLASYYSRRRTRAALAHALRMASLAGAARTPPMRMFARIAVDAFRPRVS